MKIRQIISAGGIVAFGMIAGRALGLLREISVASYFGISKVADTAILLLIIPDFITAVFIGSSVSAALIPAMVSRGKEKAIILFWQTLLVSVLFLSVIALLMLISSHYFNWFKELGNIQLFFAFFSIPLMGATAVYAAWLQYKESFTVPAFATVIFNTVILLSLWIAGGNIEMLAIGIFCASALRLTAHIIVFTRKNNTNANTINIFKGWEIDKQLIITYSHTALTGVLGMLPLYAPYAIVSASIGGIALFNYAFKLVLLPATLLQTIIQTVLLPLFVKNHYNNNTNNSSEKQQEYYYFTLHVGYILGVSVALGVSLASNSITALCFGHGKMSEIDVLKIAELLKIGIWSTPLMVLSCLWQQMFYAGNKAKSAMIASFLEAALLFPLYWFGAQFFEAKGVIIAYIIIRISHLLMIMILGKNNLFMVKFMPSKNLISSTIAMLVIFIPSAIIYQYIDFSDAIKLIIGIIIGGLTLVSGMFQLNKNRIINENYFNY